MPSLMLEAMLSLKPRTSARNMRALAALAPALLVVSSCHLLPDPAGLVVFPEAHSRNLAQLHRPDGSYKYAGIILGDFGYLAEELRNVARGESSPPVHIPSPSTETIENLTQLLSVDHRSADARARQLQWCARLVRDDSSALAREISAIGLTNIGLHIGIKELNPPALPGEACSPDDIAATFESLLREIRLSAEEGQEQGGVLEACQVAMRLPLDLNGAWRLHKSSVELRAFPMNASAKASLSALIRDLEETLVAAGLFASLADEVDRVALAGLEGLVKIEGPERLLHFLLRPQSEFNDSVQGGLLRLISEHGLPEAGMTIELRQRCISTLVELATGHRSQRVRVQGMLALQALNSDGPQSLREEDWARWHALNQSAGTEAP